MNDALQQLLDRLTALLAEKPLIGAWYTTVVRFVFPLLALMILVGAIRSLWKVKHPDDPCAAQRRAPAHHPLGEHHRTRPQLRCAAGISVGIASARRAHPRG